MGYTSWKIVLVYLVIQGIGLVVGNNNTTTTNSSLPSLTSASVVSIFNTSTTAVIQSTANSTSSFISKTTAAIQITTNLPSSFISKTTPLLNTPKLTYSSFSQTMITINLTDLANSIKITTVTLKSTSTPFVTSAASTSKTIPTAASKPENDSEPKLSVYVWEIVAYASGAFVFLLFIVIGILCCYIKSLRRKIRSLQNYSIPIKENGLWIDNQDIPLWQKRASTHNGEESQGAQESKAT